MKPGAFFLFELWDDGHPECVYKGEITELVARAWVEAPTAKRPRAAVNDQIWRDVHEAAKRGERGPCNWDDGFPADVIRPGEPAVRIKYQPGDTIDAATLFGDWVTAG